ncbi:unnamed protein product [Hyaloperonospora brassicae]|nr:unnamed protein product [Hyaloperonospora brassicae]
MDPDHWRGRIPTAIQIFLNGDLDSSPFSRQKRKSRDIGSLWVDVKNHLATSGLKLTTETVLTEAGTEVEMMAQLKLPHLSQPLQHSDITRQLRQHFKLTELERWKGLSAQSTVVRAIGGVGSCFLSRGGGMSDAEFRFALQARVDLHCPGNSRAIDGRHDRVLGMIKKAVEPIVSKSSGRLTDCFDTYVEGLPGRQLRPDIQIFDAASRTAYICDLAIAFEAQKTDDPTTGNMRVRHAEKLVKYQRAKEFLETMGWRVQVSALVYGSWDQSSSTASNAITARDEDAVSVGSDFFSDDGDADDSASAATDEGVAAAADADDIDVDATAAATDEDAARVGAARDANPTAGAARERLLATAATGLVDDASLTEPMDNDGNTLQDIDIAAQGVAFHGAMDQAAYDDCFQDVEDILFEYTVDDDATATCPDFDDSIFDAAHPAMETDDCPVLVQDVRPVDLLAEYPAPHPVQAGPAPDQAAASDAATTDPLAPTPGWTIESQDSRSPADYPDVDDGATPAPSLATLSIYPHNAATFRCVACDFVAPQLAELRAHRHRRHRGTPFIDIFRSGCACAISFAQRAAATRHSLHCGTAQEATLTAISARLMAPADTPAAEGGPMVTRRNPPPDLSTPPTSSFWPWLAARSRLRVPACSAGSSSPSPSSRPGTAASLSGAKRRRLNSSLLVGQDEDVDMDHNEDNTVDAFLRRMMVYAPDTSNTSTTPPQDIRPATAPSTPTVVSSELTRHDVSHNAGATDDEDEVDDPNDAVLDEHYDEHFDDSFDDNSDDNFDDTFAGDDGHDDTATENDNKAGTTDDGAGDNAAAGTVAPGAFYLAHDHDSTMNAQDPEPTSWTLFFDGVCRRRSMVSNAAAGEGAILFQGTVSQWTISRYLDSTTQTNNTAEYIALVEGLRGAQHHGVRRVKVMGDSALVLEQVRGRYSCNNARLRRLRNKARTLLHNYNHYDLVHVDRMENQAADQL